MGVGWEIVDKLHLVGLTLLLHKPKGLLPGQLKPLQLQLLLANLPHFALDFFHDLRGKGEGRVHIVVKPLVNGRSDGQLHLRIQALHRLGQDVGAGMPVGFPVFRVFKCILFVFFAHGNSSLYWGRGDKKRLTPESNSRGETQTVPRFHPACAALKERRRSCPL